MDDARATDLADRLLEALDAADPDAALARLADATLALPSVTGGALVDPHPLTGLFALLVAVALVRRGDAARVVSWVDDVDRRLERRHPRHGTTRTASTLLLQSFTLLTLPVLDGARASGTHDEVRTFLRGVDRLGRADELSLDGPWLADPHVQRVLAHSRAAVYDPRGQRAVRMLSARLALPPPEDDPRWREREWPARFEARTLQLAVEAGTPHLVADRLPDGLRDFGARGGFWSGRYAIEATRVLAALGRHDEALVVARDAARAGHRQAFVVSSVSLPADFVASAAFQRFHGETLTWRNASETDPATIPLADVRDEPLGGRANKRCFVSGRLVAPGDPVVRIRRLLGDQPQERFDVIARDAFVASGWQEARARFESDTVPSTSLFPPPGSVRGTPTNPAIAAFAFDVGRDPASFDLARAVDIVAQHAPPPIHHVWLQPGGDDGRGVPVSAFEPWLGEGGHGEAVNFVWRLIKMGQRTEMLRLIARLPEKTADKVFAMLATFADPVLRGAAAEHFSLPELPAMMDLSFGDKLSLDEHWKLADFGRDHPRWRAGLVQAMRSYALHLFSNSRPGVNWWLRGLEHYTLAHSSRLLFFLLHHPEEDDVLRTVLERGWLPDGNRSGSDAYENAMAFYFRAVVLLLADRDPRRLAEWIASPMVVFRCRSSLDRDTLRIAQRLLRGARGAKG